MDPSIPRPEAPVLTFLGATGTVTGSRFLLDTPDARVLVDCGLFQGLKELRLRNWAPFPVDPSTIDAVVLTHAHVDHCGYLPALAVAGFEGRVHCTPATASLVGIVLPDSGHLQEEEARWANRRGYSKHSPALPLYTEDDARALLSQLRVTPFDTPTEVAPGVEVTFRPAGHILGSAMATLEATWGDDHEPHARRFTFSGDLGRPQHPLLSPPATLGPVRPDVIVVESTYGNRRHDDEGAVAALADAITRTTRRGGTVVIPAFAVDRTEVLLHHLRRLRASGAIPAVPISVDSPMALRSLAVYRDAVDRGDPDVRTDLSELADGGGDPFDPGDLREVRDVEGSKALDTARGPQIIISASGMASGGRVLHHLARYLPDHRSTVILVGFQAQGTRGRALAEGARQVKLLGRYVPVRAEVVDLPAFSVHADAAELVDWLATAPTEPEAVYVVHGEPTASAALAEAVADRLGWVCVVPRYGERVEHG
ncbi:MBL fold metallo-hydrolase RNA specificity domain-containing protein [Rhabdothermincola salaria]|uniref:MBL fold metallo-hydrolase RNA specificity domain-containing protein n=1 Tax=Rhabdothermincola salaria TaxID=2903142 RepID=UPI001E46BAD1|nr:MBL fold metallo-hydrolase [Rhabdothermincola salaria]